MMHWRDGRAMTYVASILVRIIIFSYDDYADSKDVGDIEGGNL